jgi:hypothetical protein
LSDNEHARSATSSLTLTEQILPDSDPDPDPEPEPTIYLPIVYR